MDYLPVFLDVSGKTVLVVGGGTAAARKAELALRAGAHVRVLAAELSGDFREIRGHGRLSHISDTLEAAHLEGCCVAYGAAEDDDLDTRLHDLAKQVGILVNVPDKPEFCDFITPSIVDRSPLVIAISTAGAAPIVARMLKARLESTVPAAYGRLVSFLGSFRDLVMQRIADGRTRRRFWEDASDGVVADLLLKGDEEGAKSAFLAALDDTNTASGGAAGEVYLVGAGPGDPDLLTFRALHLIQRADVVLYDRLIGDPILNLVRRDAERIYVGKMAKNHTLPQEDISALMVRLAREGKRVLRLKGGDPFIFGRGGEEIEALAAEGIAFQVVPGITAASGCAAYAGIPLTHRDHAQSCVFVTGHGKDGQLDLDWSVLLQPKQTVAIYMGLSHLEDLLAAFIERGADPGLPAAVIDNGTRADQKVVSGTLSNLADKAAKADLKGPALIIVGGVASLRDKLNWYLPVETVSAELAQTAKAPVLN
jgi:uroporphyrin-III C-methyltransferase/precorrin-2 dehydrogenase/sirohydrochlorin ferrochelatase